MSEHRKAFFTVEESEVGNLYYFAPLTHAAGPFKEQRRVEAIIDIDADGCLAGVELIDRMPAPPKAPTDATADRVKQLEEALRPFAEFATQIAADHPGWDHDGFAVGDAEIAVSFRHFRRARNLLNGGSNEPR